MGRNASWAVVALLWACASSALALDVPALRGRVNDHADLLSAPAEARIEETLGALERDQGAQVAVLTIESLEGEALEDYSLRVAETWRLGRADEDDGALLLIAKADRAMRLEVGYGLEPVLTDVMSRRILDEIVRPRFRSGDFDGGVERAIEAIDGLIRGTSTLPPPSASNASGELPPKFFGLVWLLFQVPFIWIVLGTNPFQWFLYLFLIPFVFVGGLTAIGPSAGPVFVGAWLLGAPIVWSFWGRRRKRMPRGKRRGGGTWSAAGWSSGGGWSSG